MTPDERAAERARAAAFLDLEEGRGPVAVLDRAGLDELLTAARTIVVVGASDDPWRPSHGVFRELVEAGYRCLPVNPHVASVAGVPAYPTLAAAAAALAAEGSGPIDIVDVFRRPELCPAHAREAVAVGARALWLQRGVVSWEAARVAAEGGLAVVMDRCTAVEVARLGIGRR